ncbi:hypothetical protein FX983_06549 [Pseudomonas frederiksbergensis]|uniref:Uncharacterized protein n=1 Tax=Pseudomonas frederiksbergensis TaxID=104087 RepID=A0A6L5BK83_9PSED|nr:hypothetical protein FX983_06549 [Pseudomonas frederiksbergensis]
MIDARGTHAKLTSLGPQTFAQHRIHHLADFFDIASFALHILQAERQCRFVDVAEHVAEEHFMVFAADTQACLGHIVAVWHRSAQQMLLTEHVRFDFRREHAQRSRVVDHVVE